MRKMISIVFSFRNEEEVLDELIARNVAVLSQQPEDYELLFVNDDSTDGSLDILLKHREKNPRVKVINMSRRFGVYECLMAGVAHSSGDAVIYMDSDLQDPPELIPKMLEQWRAGADVVHTARTHRHGENPFRMWLTKQAYRLLALNSEIKLPINVGDYKLLSRRCVDHLLSMRETNPYFRGLAVWIGFKQATVYYEREARAGGLSHHGLLTAVPWQMFITGFTSFSFFPVYLVIGVGMASLALSLLAVLAAAVAAALGAGPGAYGWLVLLILFCWSSLLTAVGAVGIYITRIYKDVRGRPTCIVRETIGIDGKTV